MRDPIAHKEDATMTRGHETAMADSEEILTYVSDERPADEPAEADGEPSEPAPTEARTAPAHATRNIAVGLIASWAVLVAIPGAMPWTATDNAARAIAIAVVVATIVALIGLALAFVADGPLAKDGASFGTAAAAIAMALVALQVVNVLLIPADAAYRQAVVAIGLLILLAVALVSATGARAPSFEGFKFSSLTLVGSLIGVALVAVYLFAIQFAFGSTGPDTADAEWIRMTSLLTGLQTLAFAAAGALLGTAIQAQVTSGVKNELGNADSALDELRGTLQEMQKQAEAGQLMEVTRPDVVTELVEAALLVEPAAYARPQTRRRYLQNEVVPEVTDADEIARELRASLDRADRIRRS
jgi:hypothetical protein